MQRNFSRAQARTRAVTLGWLLGLALLAGCAMTGPEKPAGASAEPVAVPDYRQPPEGRDEVMVFFGYQCGHCLNFYRRELADFRDEHSDEVAVVLVPVIYHSSVEPAARAFHSAELMGLNPEFHEAMFSSFQASPERFNNHRAVIELASLCCEVDVDRFTDIYYSSAVEERMQQAEALQYGYRVRSTPSVLVNRERLVQVTDQQGRERLIDTVVRVLEGRPAPGPGV